MRLVRDERDELMNRLTAIKVMVPGAETMEIQQLRDYVQWQEERRVEDVRKSLYRPAHQPKKLRRQDVITGLQEYFHHYVIPKREGRKWLYGGVTIEGEAS